ncbi:MAG: hypothetical protein HY335_09105 [Deinococcus sp.]|nr:hypothetical protein [Deinococcus sp.]
MLAAALKARLQEKQLTLGPIMTFDFWPGYLEIFKQVGMHFALLDMEHGSADLKAAEELCRTARLLNFPLILRPEASVYHLIRKYLDMGPSGIMTPWTERQEQVDALHDAVFTPPRGRRGPGGPAIFHNRSLDRQGWDEVEENLFLMPQIESPSGLASMETLLAPDWIDAVMLGPYDLSVNLGHAGQMDHPEVVAAIEQVHAKAAKLRKPCGMVVGTPEQAKFWIERGFYFFLCSEVSVMVRTQAKWLLERIQELLAGGGT